MTCHRVFVYGTLKFGEPNHLVLTNAENGKSRFVGMGKTAQLWPLVIASRYNIPFLLFMEGKGHTIVGEVYDVDDRMLEALDLLEGYPEFYERFEYDVYITNSTDVASTLTKCWIYFLKKYKPSMLDLPYIENYSSGGSHGLEYVVGYKRLPQHLYSPRADVQAL